MSEETRIGKTGRWQLSLVADDGEHVLATSEWGTVYPFTIECWRALPLAPPQVNVPPLPVRVEA